MTVIGRYDNGDSRWYVDPVDEQLVYESVTTILSAATSKPWLTAWAAKLAAEFTVEHLDLVATTKAEVGDAAAVELIKGAARRKRELLAEIGQYQHDVLEALLLDTTIPPVPDHLVGVEVDGEAVDLDAISDGLLNFLTDFDVKPLMAEATVANVIHGYAGTLDLLGVFECLAKRYGKPRPIGLVDCKSGKVLEPYMRAQLAAYRRADEVWVDHMGNKRGMPQVDFCAVLHLRREYERGYKLIETPADDDAFEWFLQCQRVLKHQAKQPKIKGHPLYPPLPDGSQPPPLLEDLVGDGVGRCVEPLRAAGVRDVAQLAAMTVLQVLEVRGVGEGSIDPLTVLLAEHGLVFTGPVRCDGGVAADGTFRVDRKIHAVCPSCGSTVPAGKDGTVRFHVRPADPASEREVA